MSDLDPEQSITLAMPHIPGAKFPYEGSPPEGFEPGTFGCHEALHLAPTFMIMVEQHLAEHIRERLVEDTIRRPNAALPSTCRRRCRGIESLHRVILPGDRPSSAQTHSEATCLPRQHLR